LTCKTPFRILNPRESKFIINDDPGVGLLSVAGHKVYVSKEIGAPYIRETTLIVRFCHGAGQEGGRRAGTENVPRIVGLGRACAIAARLLPEATGRMRGMRDRLYERLRTGLPGLRLN
jgi:cysteine desulfurase